MVLDTTRLKELSSLCSKDTLLELNNIIRRFEEGIIDETGLWTAIRQNLPLEISLSLQNAYNTSTPIIIGEIIPHSMVTIVYNLAGRLKPVYCGAMLKEIVMMSGHAKFVWVDDQFMKLSRAIYEFLSYTREHFGIVVLYAPFFQREITDEQIVQLGRLAHQIEVEIAHAEQICQTNSHYSLSLEGNVSTCVSHVMLDSSQIVVDKQVVLKQPKPFIANWIISMSTPSLFFPMLFTVPQQGKSLMYNFEMFATGEFILFFPMSCIGITLVKENGVNSVYVFVLRESTMYTFTVFTTPLETPASVLNRAARVLDSKNPMNIYLLNDADVQPVWLLISATYRSN